MPEPFALSNYNFMILPIKQYKSYSEKEPLKAKILLSLFIAILTLSIIRALIPVTIKLVANSWFESNNIESSIGKIELALFKGHFAINNVTGSSETGKNFSLGRFSVSWQWKPLFSGRAFIENLELNTLKADAALYKDGNINLAGIIIKPTNEKQKIPEVQEESGPWDVTVKKIVFSDVEFCIQQLNNEEKPDLDYCATLAKFGWNGDISFNPSTKDKTSEATPVYAKGSLNLQDIALNNNQLNLALLEINKLNIKNIDVQTPLNINIEQIDINNFIALQRSTKPKSQYTQLVGFDTFSIQPLSLSELNNLKLGKITLTGTQGFLSINKKGQTDFAKWLPVKSKDSTKQVATKNKEDKKFNYAVNNFTFNTNKHFIFVDNSLKERFSADIHTVNLKLDNLDSNTPDKPSHANLSLKIDKYGIFKIDTELTPLANKISINGKGEIAGLDLRMLAPFTKQHLGYNIKSGQLDADLKLTVKKGTIDSNMGLTLHHFALKILNQKEAEELNSEFGFPLNSSLSLLRDKDNAIRLDIPVNGDITNPEFDPSDAIIKASSKAITSAILQYYTPFGLVFAAGSLFDLATALNFEPVIFNGNIAKLNSVHEEQLDKIATLMTERPGIHLTLCGVSNNIDKDVLFPEAKKPATTSQENMPSEKPLSKEKMKLLKKLAESRSSNTKNHLVNNKSIKASRLIECTPEFELDGIAGVEISI